MEITRHIDSIVNPDVVESRAIDEPKHIKRRLEMAKALLYNIEKYFSEDEYNRALEAVRLWQRAFDSLTSSHLE